MNGFRLSISYNDSYAFRERPAVELTQPWEQLRQALVPDMSGTPRSAVKRCAACGQLLDKWNESLEGLRIKKRRYDLSCTYDGVVIASDRFRQVIKKEAIEGLEFRPLPDDPNFYMIRPTAEVAYDAVKRGTRFSKPCATCGRFDGVIGATPVFLKQGATIPDRGFVRTDLEFASGDGKGPLILCGDAAAKLLNASGLKGVTALPLLHIPS